MILKTGCSILLLTAVSTAWARVPEVKVLIGKSLAEVNVLGTDLKKTLHYNKSSQQFAGRKMIKFKCQAANLKRPELLASVSSPTGFISWDDSKFQGELELVKNPKTPNCDLVNKVPMDTYIASLLSKEMNATWPIEALKAQAVAARTYAYQRINSDGFYHLESSEKDQVSGTFLDVTQRTLQASKDTQGEILMGPTGKITPAFFHSKCGGKTYRPDQVWGGMEDGYQQVECPFCHKTGMKPWKHELGKAKLTDMFDRVLSKYYSDKITNRRDIKLLKDSADRTELRFYSGTKLHVVKKSYLRNFFGRELLPSNNYVVDVKGGHIEFAGHGYGHGVGMCQLGALELAKRGYSYKDILSHYFPQHQLKKIY